MNIYFTILLVTLCAWITHFSIGNEQADVGPLTPTEADAIVRQQMAEKEQQRQAKMDELESATVIESFEADLGDRKVIFNRVMPSATTDRVAKARQAQASPTSAQFEAQTFPQQEAAKAEETLFLSATVYSDGVSQLLWTHEGVNYQAFANVDFRYLEGIASIETAETRYGVILSVSGKREVAATSPSHETAPQSASPWRPGMSDFSAGGVEYLVVSDDEAILENDAAFGAIDALLLYYQENETELRVDYQKREAIRQAKDRYRQANPSQAQDTIINFSPAPESKSLQAGR